MINGSHIIIYSQDADADRAFIQDILGLSSVDAGHGWLIFKLPPAEVAVHPTDDQPKHEFYLMCDDAQQTIADLTAKGVQTTPVEAQGWGLLFTATLPSGTALPIYQPRHPTAHSLPD